MSTMLGDFLLCDDIRVPNTANPQSQLVLQPLIPTHKISKPHSSTIAFRTRNTIYLSIPVPKILIWGVS